MYLKSWRMSLSIVKMNKTRTVFHCYFSLTFFFRKQPSKAPLGPNPKRRFVYNLKQYGPYPEVWPILFFAEE